MPSLEVVPNFIATQAWLDPIADVVQSSVRRAFAAAESARPGIEAALRGEWLGHPLHPALTDVPVGAWSAAAALDAIDGLGGPIELRATADAALGVGLIGATVTAVTGLRDWKELGGAARRVGVTHGMLNTVVAALLTVSWLLRTRGRRGLAQRVAWLGYALMLISAQLGGHLVYRQRVGVSGAGDADFQESPLARAS
jgi:uncharacterized membrane protein